MADLMVELECATKQVRNEDFAAAIESLKGILDQDSQHEIATGMLASIYLQIGHVDAAIKLYETLLMLNPENPLARFQLGLARLNNGEATAAIDVWAPMLDTENEFMANFHSALAFVQLGRNQDAIARLTHASQHMPTSHPLYPQLLNLNAKLTGRTH